MVRRQYTDGFPRTESSSSPHLDRYAFGINTANIERRDYAAEAFRAQARKLAIAVANLAEARDYMKS